MKQLASIRRARTPEKQQVAGVVKGKKEPPRKFGDYRMDYLEKGCRHDLTANRDPNLCPFCILIKRELVKHFESERVAKEQARHESLIRRASQRYFLLHAWARNQALYYHELFAAQMTNVSLVELTFSASLIQSLIGEAEIVEEEEEKGIVRSRGPLLDASSLSKILTRRRRILEVGKYAATFLQARIRKWCSLRRTRHALLRRFEFVQDARRGNFFVDPKGGNRKWQQLPSIISNERPNTPRTINRRIAGIERVQEARLSKFNYLMKKYIVDGAYKDLWSAEERLMYRTRNFTVLVDLMAASFAALKRLKEREWDRAGIQPPSGVSNSAWLAVSAPGPSSRSFGLTLALSTPNYKSLFPSNSTAGAAGASKKNTTPNKASSTTNAPAKSSKKMTGTGKQPQSATATTTTRTTCGEDAEEDVGEKRLTLAEINQRTQALETRAWDCLRCDSPLDVLSKLINPEIHPPMSSCMHIARDDYRIWRGDVTAEDPMSSYGMPAGKKPAHAAADEEDQHTKLLPLSIQLRPFRTDIGPANVFRLFYFEGEFVAATQTATWSLYPEILREKDSIMKSLLAFADSPNMNSFVCGFFAKANAPPARKRMNPASGTKFTTRPHQACIPLYVPPEEAVFDIGTYFGKAALTAEETVACSKQYKFLSKVAEFKPLLVKAQNALMRSKRAAPEVIRPTIPEASDPRISDMPRMEELQGTTLFGDFCIRAPGGHSRREEEYAEKLNSMALLTDPSFQPRVNKPDILEAEEGKGGAEIGARYDLLVIEVTVSLAASAKSTTAAATGATSVATAPVLRNCEMYQVIGVVDCKDARPPTQLDCGLIPWSFFTEKRSLQAEDALMGRQAPWTRGPSGSVRQPQQGNNLTWSTPDQQSGCIVSSNLKTGTGKDIQFAVIGALPSKDYLLSAYSKKQLRWLGLD